MPTQRPVWHDDNAAWHVTDTTNAQIASSYPNDSPSLLASGYEHGSDTLKERANIVTFNAGNSYATIAGTDINFRVWTKVDWLVIANAMYAMYQGPAKAVDAARLAAHTSFAQLSAR